MPYPYLSQKLAGNVLLMKSLWGHKQSGLSLPPSQDQLHNLQSSEQTKNPGHHFPAYLDSIKIINFFHGLSQPAILF